MTVSDGKIIFGQKQRLDFIFGDNRSLGKPENVQVSIGNSQIKAVPEAVWSMQNMNLLDSINADRTIKSLVPSYAGSLEFVGIQRSSTKDQKLNIGAKPLVSYSIGNKNVRYTIA